MNTKPEKIRSFTDLKAWQEAHKLVLMIYKIIKDFPEGEKFGLISQMCRAVVSISSNIAEGFSRRSSKEKIQFYKISQGSITELQNQLLIAKDIKYKILNTSPGQILIELIIAITLAGIIISSIIGLFVEIRQANFVSLEQTKAEFYTEEAVQALYSIREQSWSDLVNQSYPAHPVNNNGVWNLAGGSELLENNYTRQITMEAVKRNIIDGNISATGVDDPSTKKFIITISWLQPRPLSITKEIYLTRFNGNAVWNESSRADFEDGTANNVRIIDNQGGELELDYGQGEGSHTGNRFSAFGMEESSALDSENKKLSFRFSAQNTKVVDAIKVYISSTHKNSTPTYRYGLQTDNNGVPSGTWLGASNQAYGDFQTNDVGWHEIALNQVANITDGTVYHLVIEYKSGAINAGKSIKLRMLKPLNLIVPFDSSDDLNLMIKSSGDNGVTWTDVNNSPVYMLLFSDTNPELEGNPYHLASDEEVYGNHFKGEIFTYSDTTEFYNRLAVYVKKKPGEGAGALPENDLKIAIQDMTTGNIILDKVFISKNDITTDYQLHEIPLDPQITFIQDREYRFYLYSEGTSSNRSYHIEHAENIDQSADNSINYLGLNGRYTVSDNAGSSWTVYNNQDTMFRLSAIADTGYFTTGEYVSSTFDTGGLVSFNRIFWTETTSPGVTNVEFQIATNTDNATWNFVGPDGTAATRFTNPLGESIPINATSGRYLRYKAYFTTLNNQVTPTIFSVSVNYSP